MKYLVSLFKDFFKVFFWSGIVAIVLAITLFGYALMGWWVFIVMGFLYVIIYG